MRKDWPREVDNPEIIVRGICSPYHASASKKKLKPEAFDPYRGTDEISVMRHVMITADECKARSKKLADPGHGKIYAGMAALRAREIKNVGVRIVDSREEFYGHADIKIGIVRPIDEPPERGEDVKRLAEIAKALKKIANYHVDPEPNIEKWTGPPLTPIN